MFYKTHSHARKASLCRNDPVLDEGVRAFCLSHCRRKLFSRFLIHESRAHPCARTHERPIMGFSPPSPPLSHEENYKKTAFAVSLSAAADEETQRRGEAAHRKEFSGSLFSATTMAFHSEPFSVEEYPSPHTNNKSALPEYRRLRSRTAIL
ncbi:hypothetical protein EVAR_83005_1 [Eumeta japonica]|uniref:Uncharacterized protein n=1 Tax=Eumeta variegata TaxID=151549 RepID=A0A4C1VTB4_EUMVA|nr:hypothetical protein EVAR_83005_1 [Eumeta japonica]